MANIVTGFAILLITFLGIGTYIRNMAWADERTLWQDALEKAPGSARPYQNLAVSYYKIGDYDTAIELNKNAIDLWDSTNNKTAIISFKNIAKIHAGTKQNHIAAIKYYHKILDLEPNEDESRYNLILSLVHTGQLDKAMENIDILLSNKAANINYLNIAAFVLIKQQNPKKALTYLQEAIKINPDDARTLTSLGIVKSMIGNYASCENYLDRVSDSPPQKNIPLLLQIENSLRAGDVGGAEEYAEKLISKSSPASIRKTIEEANKPGMLWPVSADLVAPVIARVLREQSEMFSSIELAHGSN